MSKLIIKKLQILQKKILGLIGIHQKRPSLNKNLKRKIHIIDNVEKQIFRKRKKQLILDFRFYKNLKPTQKNIKIYYSVSAISLLIIFIVLIFGPIFTIKYINIIKKDELTDINIAYKSIDNIRGEKILLVKKQDIKDKIKNYQENVKNIEIDTIFPNTLKIFIESYKGLFNTNINGKNYTVTENGVLIPSHIKKELKNIIIISNFNTNLLFDYKHLLSQENITNIYNSIQKLEDNIIDLKIQDITYFQIQREIHIKLESNTILIFSLDDNMDSAIKKAAIFNKDHLPLYNTEINYIDFRIKNKVFYCLNEDKKICEGNLKKIYY